MHFAGLKAVGESMEQPLRYYRVNLTASMNLLEVSSDLNIYHPICRRTSTIKSWLESSFQSSLWAAHCFALITVFVCWVHDSMCSFDIELTNSNTASFITFSMWSSLCPSTKAFILTLKLNVFALWTAILTGRCVPCLCASACIPGDAGSQRAQSGLQQLSDGVWRPPAPTHWWAASRGWLRQPLRQEQVLHRGDDQRPL